MLMRLLSIMLLLTGCPAPKTAPVAAGEPTLLLTAEQVFAKKVGAQQIRGLWWLEPTAQEQAYMHGSHLALSAPDQLESFLASSTLPDDQRDRVRSWLTSGSRGAHVAPMFAARDRVVLVVRDGALILRAGGYVVHEAPYTAEELDDRRLRVLERFTDGTSLEHTATFDTTDGLVIDNEIGVFEWLVGHGGPLHFQKDP